jgi:hypothetical protein
MKKIIKKIFKKVDTPVDQEIAMYEETEDFRSATEDEVALLDAEVREIQRRYEEFEEKWTYKPKPETKIDPKEKAEEIAKSFFEAFQPNSEEEEPVPDIFSENSENQTDINKKNDSNTSFDFFKDEDDDVEIEVDEDSESFFEDDEISENDEIEIEESEIIDESEAISESPDPEPQLISITEKKPVFTEFIEQFKSKSSSDISEILQFLNQDRTFDSSVEKNFNQSLIKLFTEFNNHEKSEQNISEIFIFFKERDILNSESDLFSLTNNFAKLTKELYQKRNPSTVEKKTAKEILAGKEPLIDKGLRKVSKRRTVKIRK